MLFIAGSAFAKPDKFKVGMILPLSGPAADYGQSLENCIRLAKEDHPENFTNIEFIAEDAQHDVKQAISAFQKLTEVDKVDFIYTWGVPFCKGLAPIAEARKIPLIGQCINQDASQGKKYVLRFMNYTDEYLRAQAKYLKEKKLNKLGLILAEHPYLEDMYNALKRSLQNGQTIEEIDRYQINSSDFRSSISKIRNSDYDSIGVFLYAGQISLFYRQLKEQKLDPHTFGTNFFETLSEVNTAGSSMDDAIFSTNDVNADFVERYKNKFKNVSAIGFGALGYEFATLTGELFNSGSEKLTPEEIIKSFSNMKERKGTAAGPYSFRDSKEAGMYVYFPVAIKRIQDKNFIVESLY